MWQLCKKVVAGLLLAGVMQVTAAQGDVQQQLNLMNQEVGKLHQQGNFPLALETAKQALAIAEKTLGAEHPTTGTSLNNLAVLYGFIGEYSLAVPLFKRALAIDEEVHGPEHPTTGASLANLASVLESMEEYLQALPLYKRALAIAEKAHGPEHPTTGSRLNNLAALYQSMGEYLQALPLNQRALAIAEKTAGPEHPATGTRLNNLAILHREMGEYSQALPLYKRALAIAEKAHGPEHPTTGASLNNLATLYQSMGEYLQALPLSKRALAISEKAHGAEHPATGIRLNNLALLYKSMGEYLPALSLYKRALAITEKVQGAENTSTAANLNNLAALYSEMGEYLQALPLSKRALAITEKVQGPEHPEIGARLNNLADLYEATGEPWRALALYKRALAIAEKTQGPEHPSTGVILDNLAGLYQSMGDYLQALALYQRALAIAEKAQGPEHPATCTRLNNLASLHFAMNQEEQTLLLLQRSFAIAVSRASTDPDLLALAAKNLCFLHQSTKRTSAIFYCKLAVNTRQSQRLATKNLPSDLQKSFGKKTEDVYLQLYGLLTQANRSTEGAQVLRAMKEVEFSVFVKGQTITKSQIDLTSSEADLNNFLRESAAKFQPLLAKQDALRQAKAEQTELDKLQHQINIANKHLYETFEQIPVLLKSSDEEAKVQFKIDNNIFFKHLANLNAATPGEKNAIIVIAASNERTQISTFYEREPLQLDLPIAKDKLSQLVTSMQAGIVAKTDAWRAPARELHALLIAPIEAQLAVKQFTPQNLSFVISGDKLDIPPLAVLLDANGNFLASKYRLSLYNPRSGSDALQDWKKNWDITAFGSTKGEPSEKLLPLPLVANELANIVRSDKTPQGVLPGEKYLDQQFTRQAWGQSIANNASITKRRVLHVATHFKIDINQHQSKLLLGDGQFYSAAEIAAEPGLPLSSVDLVTLSACDTMQRKVGKGSSFEGLGALFQYKGASAVLGTLWAVVDGSTAELMQKFYANRGEQRKMSKAQALQEAQKAMLASETWQHPYFWAGFVLMGNWL